MHPSISILLISSGVCSYRHSENSNLIRPAERRLGKSEESDFFVDGIGPRIWNTEGYTAKNEEERLWGLGDSA